MTLKVTVLIAARSGSKALRHKNVRKLDGVPLLVRAVRLAKKAQPRAQPWRIAVSSDSRHYGRLAKAAGAEWIKRPERLSGDATRLVEVVRHAEATLGLSPQNTDALLLLSATHPLTHVGDIRGALELFARKPEHSVVAVHPDPVRPSWRVSLNGDRVTATGAPRVERRQVGKTGHVLSGALYIAAPGWLDRHPQFLVPNKTQAYRLPPERSLDIETAHDLWLAEQWLCK